SGRIDGDVIAHMRANLPSQFRAHQQGAAIQIEGACEDAGVQHTDVRFVFRINSPNQRRGRALPAELRFGLDHDLAEDRRRDGANIAIGTDRAHERRVIGNARFDLHNPEMRIEAEDLVAKLLVEAAHQTDYDDQLRYTEHH